MLNKYTCLTLFLACIFNLTHGASKKDEPIDDYVFELEAFEVIADDMRIVDGFTGEVYEGTNPVIREFRRSFRRLLTGYHKKLLVDEAQSLKARSDIIIPFSEDLAAMASRFGIGDFVVQGPHLTREISIFKRMVKDPFFAIDELVIWDYARLEALNGERPNSKYAKDLRYNEETGRWERRVITKWDVSYIRNDRSQRQIYVSKEQGLNLDTHKGYHVVTTGGLPPDVPSHAFQNVKLQYPIFYNTGEPTDVQVSNLSENFLINLIYIYDPYSWVVRGNTRFRGGFYRQLREHLEGKSLPVTDRDWFSKVLAHFLNDIVTIKYWGPDEIYDLEMLAADQINKNQLGIGLDLLNWHKDEKRALDYDPTTPHRIPHISFDNPVRARFVMLDAYRRYGDKFLDALANSYNAIEKRADPKQLIMDAIEEASGIPAEKYIAASIKAQRAELRRFLRTEE